MSAGRTQFWLWGILTVALTLRLGAAVMVQRYVAQTPGRLCLIAGDAEGYWELGRKLAHGQAYEIYDPPRRVLRMPGFPGLLAFSIALFGEDVGAARIVLAVIGTLACGSVYWLGTELFGRTNGLIAAALAAVSPLFVATSVMILSEMTFGLGVMLSLIGLARLVRLVSHSGSGWQIWWAAVIAGLGGALACYIRPSWLLFPLFAAEWLLVIAFQGNRTSSTTRSRSMAVLGGVGIVFGLIVGLLPWTYRNYVVSGGHIIPTTLWMGPSLYDGLNPEANGDSHMEFLERDNLYTKLSEYEVDQHYRRAAWSWAAQHPGRTLSLAGIKLARYANLWPNTPQFDRWTIRIVLLAFLVPVLVCTIWGLWVGRSRVGRLRAGRSWINQTPVEHSRLPIGPDHETMVGTTGLLPVEGSISWTWVVILTVGPIVYFAGLHALFVGSLRYRLPAEYPLLIVTALGIQDLFERFRGRRPS